MKKVINLYKPLGLTPLEAVNRFKSKFSIYKNKKTSYPGRLDPMAEGVLLILIGNENKKMRLYMKLDKEYVAEIIFGFSTDSYDILGIPLKNKTIDINIKDLKKQIKKFKGIYVQSLPVYSSYKINRKPLFYYARNNKLKDIKIPKINVKIKEINIIDNYYISSSRLLKEIKRKISLVSGDFRQKQIIKEWENLLKNNNEKYLIFKLKISCSSGTYIRAIANDLGKNFSGGLLFSLKRTKIGRYKLRDSSKIN